MRVTSPFFAIAQGDKSFPCMLQGPNTIPKGQLSMKNYFYQQVERCLDNFSMTIPMLSPRLSAKD